MEDLCSLGRDLPLLIFIDGCTGSWQAVRWVVVRRKHYVQAPLHLLVVRASCTYASRGRRSWRPLGSHLCKTQRISWKLNIFYPNFLFCTPPSLDQKMLSIPCNGNDNESNNVIQFSRHCPPKYANHSHSVWDHTELGNGFCCSPSVDWLKRNDMDCLFR